MLVFLLVQNSNARNFLSLQGENCDFKASLLLGLQALPLGGDSMVVHLENVTIEGHVLGRDVA